MSLHDVADLLKVQEIDGATVANAADVDVVVTVGVVDASTLVLEVVLSGLNVLVLNRVARSMAASHFQ